MAETLKLIKVLMKKESAIEGILLVVIFMVK